jgi:hypothetical protein
VAFSPTIFDGHVLAFDITGVSEALPERSDIVGPLGSRSSIEEPDYRHRLLPCAASGHAAEAPLNNMMNSRRLITR